MIRRNNTVQFGGSTVPNSPITYEVMHRLFTEKKIIRGKNKNPNATALAQLARSAETLRKSSLLAPLALAAARATYKSVARVAILRNDLRAAAETYDKIERIFDEFDAISTADPGGGGTYNLRQQFRMLGNGVRNLLADVEAVNLSIHLLSAEYDEVQRLDVTKADFSWHEIAERMLPEFLTAVRSTNPNLVLEVSNDGPISRFVVSIIPLITGETPKSHAVARFLQRKSDALS